MTYLCELIFCLSDGNSLITIDHPESGTYFIRVDCLAICYYSITAMTLEATVQLEDGIPVTASIDQSNSFVLNL